MALAIQEPIRASMFRRMDTLVVRIESVNPFVTINVSLCNSETIYVSHSGEQIANDTRGKIPLSV